MNVKGKIVFTISSNAIDLAEIKKNIKIKPSKIIQRGSHISIDMIAEKDVIMYEVKFLTKDEMYTKLNALLQILTLFKAYINFAKEKYDFGMNLFLRSNDGQIGIDLPYENIKMLQDIGVGLSVNMLSFSIK